MLFYALRPSSYKLILRYIYIIYIRKSEKKIYRKTLVVKTINQLTAIRTVSRNSFAILIKMIYIMYCFLRAVEFFLI